MSQAVVIVHGLFMSPLAMKVLEKRLQDLGYETYNFGYPSRQYTHRTLERLHALCCSIKADEIYFLGHSMGGIVINHYLSEYTAPEQCRKVVTLGTPYNGSRIAKYFSHSAYGNLLFGHDQTEQALISGITGATQLPTGIIIGTKNIGVGFAFGIEQGDGTVSLEEASHPLATDQYYLPVSHTALIYSKRAARLADHFFKHGRFN